MSIPKRSPRPQRLIPLLALTLALALTPACGGDGDSQNNNNNGQDAGHDTSDNNTQNDTGETDTGDTGSDTGDTDPLPDFKWPVPTSPIALTPHESWKERIVYWDDPFITGNIDEVRWVKFSVLMGDPSRVIFQDSFTYHYHYDFVTERLAPFKGKSHTQFDAISLHEQDQQIILGAVLFPPVRSTDEIGIQLVRQDAYHPQMVKTIYDLVKNSIDQEPARPVTPFYFPAFDQLQSTIDQADAYQKRNIEISSVDRWLTNDVCYSNGWAYGRLVYVPGAEIAAAYRAGTLLHTDILLTEGVPAEVPHVAGIISLTAGVPNSHVAILAASYQIPYIYLRHDDERQHAQALVGKQIVLRARPGYGVGCNIKIVDATGLPQETIDTLLDAKTVEPIDYRPKQKAGHYAVPTDALTPADIVFYGGKAANFGMIRRALPNNSAKPTPMAFSFDLWDEFIEQEMPGGKTLREEVAERLAPFATYPPQIDTLEDALEEIRIMFEKYTVFTPAQTAGVLQALEGFDDLTQIRFRSSTNLEDAENFTGAGLYKSNTGCKADDLDDNEDGPSLCDPARAKERGVFRAIRHTFASFYNTNAYLERLRHGVNESELGMAMLAHYSDPDPTEIANGVITLKRSPYATELSIVTQPGAASVTNPDSYARPEIVAARSSDWGIEVTFRQYSDLLPIGRTTLTDVAEYEELIGYIKSVMTEFERLHPTKTEYLLDLEYKKLQPGWLVIRQVREIPAIDQSANVTPILINEPMELCVYQGESSNVFAIHRAKLRWNINMRSGELTPVMRAQTLYKSVVGEQLFGDTKVPTTGAPSAWPAASFNNGADGTVDSWSLGQGPAKRDYALRTTVPTEVSANRTPIVFPSDLSYSLTTNFTTPQPATDWSGAVSTTSEDLHISLGQCPDNRPLTASYNKRETNIEFGKNRSAMSTYWWPPAPTGITAGYTAPLVRFDQTVVAGYSNASITLTNYYAQTYRPQHHNFSEDFYFDFMLEPNLSNEVLDELRAKNVRALIQSFDKTYAVGFNGVLRAIGGVTE